jgi:nucleoside-diphosphate-sugar epimerase
MDKVVVTGAGGFIGSHLVERLVAAGCRVVAIDNFWRGRQENLEGVRDRIQLVEADITDASVDFAGVLSGAEVLFHFAAINGTRHFYERPLEILRVNLEGTIRLLEAAGKAGVRKVVFASSSEVYGEPLYVPTPEDHPVLLGSLENPRHSYAAAKAASEFYVRWVSVRYGMEGLILRIFNTYGPRMDSSEYGQVVPEFIRKAIEEDEFTIIGDGRQVRSFCYIDDLVELIMRLCRLESGVFNVGCSEPTSIEELARLVHEIVGRKFQPRYLPGRPGDVLRRQPSIEKAVRATGYEPRVSLREGLERTVEWYMRAGVGKARVRL